MLLLFMFHISLLPSPLLFLLFSLSKTLISVQDKKIDQQIVELERKIAVERKVKMGADAMRSQIKDKIALAQVEMSIEESQKRLMFLEEQMARLMAKKSGSDSPTVVTLNDSHSAVFPSPVMTTSPSATHLQSHFNGSNATLSRRTSPTALPAMSSDGSKPGFFKQLMKFGSSKQNVVHTLSSSSSMSQVCFLLYR
jgi:hypothetical protein